MGRKNLLKQKTAEGCVELTKGVAVTSVGADNSFENLSVSLGEIRKLKGVLGFILRNDSSAIIDLNEQDQIIEYAILSTQIHDSCQEIAKQFNLGETESMLVEGIDIKVLCMAVGENRMSIFMEKKATHSWIIKRILL
jgi:predicted regulator of Ras-like GTPase activity (Roadblock/LC7/MglB family)